LTSWLVKGPDTQGYCQALERPANKPKCTHLKFLYGLVCTGAELLRGFGDSKLRWGWVLIFRFFFFFFFFCKFYILDFSFLFNKVKNIILRWFGKTAYMALTVYKKSWQKIYRVTYFKFMKNLCIKYWKLKSEGVILNRAFTHGFMIHLLKKKKKKKKLLKCFLLVTNQNSSEVLHSHNSYLYYLDS
jgi:hypothetical protein